MIGFVVKSIVQTFTPFPILQQGLHQRKSSDDPRSILCLRHKYFVTMTSLLLLHRKSKRIFSWFSQGRIRPGIRSFKIFTCLCQKTFCSGLSAFVCYDYKQNIFGTFRFLESRKLSPCGHGTRHPDSFFEQNPATTFKSKNY